MARINIEDSLFKDDGFGELIARLGSRTMALGAMVEAFIIAQKYYTDLDNDRLVPLVHWNRLKVGKDLLECGLAEIKNNGIYVRGSKEQFGWLVQRSEAGKNSARIKAEARSTTVNDRSTELNGSQALTLTPSLSQEELKPMGEAAASPAYDLELIYQEYPKRLGNQKKGTGMERLKKICSTEEKYLIALRAVRAYRKYLEGEKKIKTSYVKQFGTFFDSIGDWKEWANPEDKKQSQGRLIINETLLETADE